MDKDKEPKPTDKAIKAPPKVDKEALDASIAQKEKALKQHKIIKK